MEQLANNARSSLAGSVDASQGTWTIADASSFPLTGEYRVVCENEYALCTGRTGNVLSVTRGQEGSTAAAHVSGSVVTCELTVAGLTNFVVQNSVPSGTGMLWFSNTPPSGWLILDGTTIANAQTAYPSLWANVDPAWKSGSNIILPDMRGRVPVGMGTHADVNTFADNDGIALASRRPKHAHDGSTLTMGTESVDHTHSGTTGYVSNDHTHGGGASALYAVQSQGGSTAAQVGTTGGISANHTHAFTTGGRSAGHTHAISGTVGAAGMTDTPAYQVVNFIIKL